MPPRIVLDHGLACDGLHRRVPQAFEEFCEECCLERGTHAEESKLVRAFRQNLAAPGLFHREDVRDERVVRHVIAARGDRRGSELHILAQFIDTEEQSYLVPTHSVKGNGFGSRWWDEIEISERYKGYKDASVAMIASYMPGNPSSPIVRPVFPLAESYERAVEELCGIAEYIAEIRSAGTGSVREIPAANPILALLLSEIATRETRLLQGVTGIRKGVETCQVRVALLNDDVFSQRPFPLRLEFREKVHVFALSRLERGAVFTHWLCDNGQPFGLN